MRNYLYDLLCVGFGPAAIALATTIEDWVEARGIERPDGIIFLERAAATSWHGNLLLPGTIINHHYLRDLATPRNPRSRFTFTNYLKEVGRLFDVGHLDGKVGRSEWSNYITWVANQLSDYVKYKQEGIGIRPVINSGKAQHLYVITRDDSYLTRNLVIATGPKPRVPPLYWPYLSDTCFHTSEFLEKICLLDKKKLFSSWY
ncbi:MAG: SidA/IucD/PvdA family monooxygenase [Nitrososphaera sp.]